MNKLHLINSIKHPELLNERTLSAIENILEEYPFFQSAHLLYIKNLHNQGSIKFDRELKKTAVWITDRRKLFYLLDNRVLLPVEEDEKIEVKQNAETETLDFSILSHAAEIAEEYIAEEEAEKEAQDELDSIIRSGSASLGTFFNVGDKVDLEDFKNTFNKKDKKTTKPLDKTETAQTKNQTLIDSFIKAKPKIVPKPVELPESKSEFPDFSEDSNKEDSYLMTDTLAKIYIKQGLYEKAIATYEKLSLKYPEKNIYFAGQIEKIKQIINNK